jgi:FMN-dependent NADH-azoreductase
LKVIYRDLTATPIPHLTGAAFLAAQGSTEPEDVALRDDVALGRTALDEFLAADILVLGLGFYNFGVPSQLKAWVDRLAVVGKTFRYTDKGPVGLAGGKRVILAISRGGFYGQGTPTAPMPWVLTDFTCRSKPWWTSSSSSSVSNSPCTGSRRWRPREQSQSRHQDAKR